MSPNAPGTAAGRQPGPRCSRETPVASRQMEAHEAAGGVGDLGRFGEGFAGVVANVERAVQGKREVVRLALVCLVAEGHLLIEDVPGVGKTTLAKALAASVDCDWGRIQFTPDLLPSDVTGVSVYDRSTGSFDFRPGGIFANVVLADEINRASPKTQAALLEAMEERQATVEATTHKLPSPFMVIATQNPFEHEGTYPLPDSQLDRFLMRVSIGYPSRAAEIEMLGAHADHNVVDELVPVMSASELDGMIAMARSAHVAPALRGYVVDLVTATRQHPAVELGASPRAALALQRAARSLAVSWGRDFVLPDDIKALAGPVLEHRVTLSRSSGASPSEVLSEVLSRVAVPAPRSLE
ncbi:MAG: AAA family ATPase [Acidimicrobiales bacterium]